MKSRLVSVFWPTWEWISKPSLSYIFSSYALDLARDHSVDRAAILTSEWYRRNWGNKFNLATDTKTLLQNDQHGQMYARGTGGAGTGKGGERVIVDDPHNTKQAESDIQRESGLLDFDRNLSTRLNDPNNGAIIIIMQRLHERDLSGHVLQDAGYTHVKIKAIEESARTITFPKSGRVIERAPGDILWPERHSRDALDTLKKRMGTYAFEGQYQQNPVPVDGGLFKRSWWKFYKEFPYPLDTVDQWVMSWDMAFKDSKDSAYVVGQIWARKGANRYLMDQVRARLDFPDTVKAFIVLCNKWPQVSAKLIEDKANGPAVISTLQHKIPGIIAINPRGSKEARASSYAVRVEAGNVFLPHPDTCGWVEDFIVEHERCPKGEYWDQIDSASQADEYMIGIDNFNFDEDDLIGHTMISAGGW